MSTIHPASHLGCTQPLMATPACRRALADEQSRGWPTLADTLAATYGAAWRAHADEAASALLAHGHVQHGHDGTELVLVTERPWRTLVATFDDDVIVGLVAEHAGTVSQRGASGQLVTGSPAPPAFWASPVSALVGPLGVLLRNATDWVVVDHTGRWLLASSMSASAPSIALDDALDDAGDDDCPAYVLVRQPVTSTVVVPVGWRCGGLAWDLTRRHALVHVAPPSDPVLHAAACGRAASARRVA